MILSSRYNSTYVEEGVKRLQSGRELRHGLFTFSKLLNMQSGLFIP
ncbi:hypothetical protein KDA_15360 [Dictyobacter alpinus]|uniref:Uncharacterized protein n=1 Tax=Dictyobacter alpinus TaxID=2014873 RepID=A0A402B3Y3_9CHLR|nr:hypothetical protein KDA_15360 [Dictyobacter alpinus]